VVSGHSKNGLTTITVTFDEPVTAGSVSSLGLYAALGGVKKKKKTTFSKGLAFMPAKFDGSATVTLTLARPFKGQVQVTVHGGVMATNGASSSGDVTRIVQ
jgi:hypothetical protein